MTTSRIKIIAAALVAFDSSWDLVYHGKASDGPDATISGFYLRIVIGGAWRR
jgi:hypothetical protein